MTINRWTHDGDYYEENELMEALVASGYKHSQRRFTPKQVEIIYSHLGEP